jgi:hypothetical protein
LACHISKEVLVYTSEEQVRIGYFHQGKMKVSCHYCDEDSYVTHWMPLPNQPEEK